MNNCEKDLNGNKTVFIVGPTASGKSFIAHQLAKKIKNAEIISADSMQVYSHMDIITAKPTLEDRNEISYHLVDYVRFDNSYSVSDFYGDAVSAVKMIQDKGKIPIIVGGTGMYVRTLLKGICDTPSSDEVYRSQMRDISLKYGSVYLHDKLCEIDAVSADSIPHQNVRRVIRALEVYKITGEKFSDLKSQWDKPVDINHPVLGRLFLWGVFWPRVLMYERINSRVDEMIKQGLIDEVKQLLELGVLDNQYASQALGIKEILTYINDDLDLEGAVKLLKRNTRRFAKRQLTWFGKEDGFDWFFLLNDYSFCKVIADMYGKIKK